MVQRAGDVLEAAARVEAGAGDGVRGQLGLQAEGPHGLPDVVGGVHEVAPGAGGRLAEGVHVGVPGRGALGGRAVGVGDEVQAVQSERAGGGSPRLLEQVAPRGREVEGVTERRAHGRRPTGGVDEGDVVADPGEAHRGRDAGEGAADDGDVAHQAGAGFLRRLNQRW